MKKYPWMIVLIGLGLFLLFVALPLSAANGQPANPAWLLKSPTRWPTVTRRLTDTRWPTATRSPTRTLRATDTRWPGTGRRPTSTRWPTIFRRPTDTRWPSPTIRFTASRWPTITRGSPATRQPTPTFTQMESETPLPSFTPASPAGWVRYFNGVFSFEFYYPSDANITSQDDSHVEMFFTVMPGTNLVEKYLDVNVSNAELGCPASNPGTPAGSASFNGYVFQIGTGADAGAGQMHEFTTYSLQQGSLCYGFSFILHSSNIGALPPGTPEFDQAAESALFPMIMNTFQIVPPTPAPSDTPVPTDTPLPTLTSNWTATRTPTITRTFTVTRTSTNTRTPTKTPWPTNTTRPTATRSPTFDFPKVTIKVGVGSCRFGPSVAYMHAEDVLLGDKGVVWGRAANSTWLYVKMDKWTVPCWVAPSLVTVDGNILRVGIQPVRLPTTNALYAPPTNVRAVRNGNQVTISWDVVWMTLDDDRGYFLDVFVCQNGLYLWWPVGLPDQYHNSYTFTDSPGCSSPSGGKLYTVEKHGYTSPVTIPWAP